MIKFYSRIQGNMVFNFYCKDKKLIAEVNKNSHSQQLQIDSIPTDMQTNLDNDKIIKLQKMFEQSFFDVQNGKILANGRILGSWNKEIHSGYEKKGWFFNKRIESTSLYGTYNCAINTNFSPDESMIIADACQSVDNEWSGWFGLEAIKTFISSGKHFGGSSWDTWMTGDDPRRQYAIKKLVEAVITNRKGEKFHEQSLKSLGEGLHALQDSFSHNPDFVICILGKSGCFQTQYADDPKYLPQRIEYTKLATYAYLSAYLANDLTHAVGKLSEILDSARSALPMRNIRQLQDPRFFGCEQQFGNSIVSSIQPYNSGLSNYGLSKTYLLKRESPEPEMKVIGMSFNNQ